MRHLITLLFLLACSVFPAIPVQAAPGQVTVVYNNGVPPMKFTNAQGEADGILIDLWRLWSEKSDVPVVFREANWEQAQKMVKSGEADVHAGMFYTEQRDEEFDYTRPLKEMAYYIYVESGLPNVHDREDLQGFKIGVPKGYTQRFTEETLTQSPLAVYDDFVSLYQAALRRDVRALVSPATNLRYYLRTEAAANIFQRLSDTPAASHGERSGGW